MYRISNILTYKTLGASVLIFLVVFMFSNDYFIWISRALVVISFIVYLAYSINNRNIEKKILLTVLCMFLWIVIPFLLTPISHSITDHLTYFVIALLYGTFGIIIFDKLLSNERQLIGGIIFLNILWTTINLTLFLLYITNIYTNYKFTFSGIVDNRNVFSIITTLLFTLTLFYRRYFLKKKLINLILIVNVILVLSSVSMKGFLGISFIILTYFWLNSKFIKKTIAFILFFVAFALIISVPNPVKERFDEFLMIISSPEKLKIEDSAFERKWLLAEGYKLHKEYPLGIGLNNTHLYLKPPYRKVLASKGIIDYDDIGVYSHNNYLELLISGGFLTIFLFYMPQVIILFTAAYKINKKDNKLIFTLLSYKLLLDFALVSYYTALSGFILAFVLLLFFKQNNITFFKQKELQVA